MREPAHRQSDAEAELHGESRDIDDCEAIGEAGMANGLSPSVRVRGDRMEIEEAVAALTAELQPISAFENVPLTEAAGRVLAEDIRAAYDVPHFPKSAMDGYAVCAEDVKDAAPDHPVSLRVLGEMLAGDAPICPSEGEPGRDAPVCPSEGAAGRDAPACPSEGTAGSDAPVCPSEGAAGSDAPACPSEGAAGRDAPVSASEGAAGRDVRGTAVRIMTGAAIPEGYDAVVRQEDTDYGEAEVRIFKGVAPYTNYCRIGEDIRKGSVVLTAGRRMGRVEAGVLASLGIPQVPVVRRLKVAIISTGSELCDVSDKPEKTTGFAEATANVSDSLRTGHVEEAVRKPEAGRIYNSLAYTLTASLAAAGFSAEHCICADEAEEIAAVLERVLQTSDVVITTGGVSVGKKDLLPEVLDSIGAKRIFSGINVQPGTPTIGSVKDGKAILSLSGNPYAALVNYDLYFWPVAAKLTGCDAYLPVIEDAVLESEYPRVNRLRRLLRAHVAGGRVTIPAKSHASSVLSNLLNCNCYIDLPKETEVHPGDTVKVIRMP